MSMLKKPLKLIKKKSSNTKEQPLIEKDNKKNKKNIVPSLRKIKATMGNLTSTKFYLGQHSIEDEEEHAFNVMQQLNVMRQQGTHCDLTINRQEGGKFQAHNVVVSYNPTLLNVAVTAKQSTSVDGYLNPVQNGQHGHKNLAFGSEENLTSSAPPLEDNSLIKQLNAFAQEVEDENKVNGAVDADEDASENGDSKSSDNKDGKSSQESDDNKSTDEDCGNEELKKSLAAELSIAYGISQNLDEKDDNSDDEEKNGKSGDSSEEQIQESSNDDKDEAKPSEEIKENGIEQKTVINDLTNQNKSSSNDIAVFPTSSTTIELNVLSDGIATPMSLYDPVEILVNYLYTSKIDITQKNVGKLRVLAKQCDMSEVSTACDEFDNVLRTETESMTSLEEKDKAASQFRYQFSDSHLFPKMLQHFNNLRTQGKYTDVSLKPSSKSPTKMSVHSTILEACCNEFFQSKTGNCEMISTSQTTSGEMELELLELDDHVSKHVVEYLYTAKIGVSAQNVKFLMEAAQILKLPAIMNGCSEFIEGIITAQNSVEFYREAKKYKCEKLEAFILKFMKENFKSITKSSEFLNMSSEELLSLVKCDDITLEYPVSEGEMSVFRAVTNWINHDVIKRKPELNKVMEGVRFELIGDRNLIDHVTTDLLIMENDTLCKHVAHTVTCKQHNAFDNDVTMRGKPTVIFIGGSSPIDDVTSEDLGYQETGYSGCIYTYDITTGKQHELGNMAETRALHCSLVCDQFVYVIGGFDNFSCMTNSVLCLDMSSGTWHDTPNMKVKRVCFSAFATQKYLYVVGGLTPSGYTATVERFDRQNQKWKTVSSIPTTCYRHAGCMYKEEYFVSGGYEGQDHVFAYNPTTDYWRKVAPLKHGRDSHVMCTVDNKIYVIGGDASSLPVESYDDVSDTWTVIWTRSPGISSRLYLPGHAVIGSKVYLFGGWHEENEATDDILCFDTSRDDWHHVKHHLAIPRGSMSSNLVRLPTSYQAIKFAQPAKQ